MLSVSLKNITKAKAVCEKILGQSEAAVKRTVSDFRSRAPAWISMTVADTYNIKKAEVKGSIKGRKGKGTVNVGGKVVDNVQLVISGHLLTVTHFGMKPKKPTGRPQAVTAEIFKGQRKALGPKVFLADILKDDGTYYTLPFQRKGEARYPLEVIRTLSIPQMVQNEKVSKDMYSRINEELGKRFENHMKNALK